MRYIALACILAALATTFPSIAHGDPLDTKLQKLNASRNPEAADSAALDRRIADLAAKNDIPGLRALVPDPNSPAVLRAMLNGQDDTVTPVKVGAALFALGDYDWVFRNILHLGDGPRGIGYKALKAAGAPAIPSLVAYLPTADLHFDNAGYALDQVVTYLDDQGALATNGGVFARFLDSSYGELTRYAAALAVGGAKTASAEPGVRALLASEKPVIRQRAVWALGELGLPESIPALQPVAESDPAFKLIEKDGIAWKDYYVRAKARAAIEEIRVKN